MLQLCAFFPYFRAMVYKLEVRNVNYQVMPDEVRNTLQALQVADGLQSIRLDRAEGWKEQFENLIRKWGPDFLCQLVLMFNTEEQAKLCARVLHGRWIAGLSKPGNKTCSLERFYSHILCYFFVSLPPKLIFAETPGLSALTFGDPDGPQGVSGCNIPSAQSGGCRSHLPIYPDFVSVDQSALRPMLPAAATIRQPVLHLCAGETPHAVSAPNAMGLASVPRRPSLSATFRTNDAPGDSTTGIPYAPASHSTSVARRSRSPVRRVPLEKTDAFPSASSISDVQSDDALRASLRHLLADDSS